MPVNRLFLMVYLLLEKGMVTAPELAKRFEVSVRTIYRDIDILSSAGVPIYTTQGNGGGISIQENYVLNKSLLSEQEQNQILMALQGLELLDGQNTQEVFSKLSGIFKKPPYQWIEIDFADWNKDSDGIFQQLKYAIFQNKKVEFQYYGAGKEPSLRVVEPLKLIFKDQSWYLYAYCCLREDYRLFKLTRIKKLSITSQGFTRSAPARVLRDLDPYHVQDIALTLLFDKSMGSRVYDHFDDVTETEGGCFLVNTRLPHNDWLYTFLLSFGSKVKVIRPDSVRDEIIARIDQMREAYQT